MKKLEKKAMEYLLLDKQIKELKKQQDAIKADILNEVVEKELAYSNKFTTDNVYIEYVDSYSYSSLDKKKVAEKLSKKAYEDCCKDVNVKATVRIRGVKA